MAFIMVVDDEVSVRLMMQKRLQKENHQVVTAESTAEALRILQQRDLEDLVAARTKALQASNDQSTAPLESVRTPQATIDRQERLNALGKLPSGIAHDLNNALMPILGLTDYLLTQIKADGGSQEQIEILDTVLSAARDAQSVVQRLRGFKSK